MGRMTRQTDPLGWQWQFEYDNAGNLVTTTDPQNHTVKASFDAGAR